MLEKCKSLPEFPSCNIWCFTWEAGSAEVGSWRKEILRPLLCMLSNTCWNRGVHPSLRYSSKSPFLLTLTHLSQDPTLRDGEACSICNCLRAALGNIDNLCLPVCSYLCRRSELLFWKILSHRSQAYMPLSVFFIFFLGGPESESFCSSMVDRPSEPGSCFSSWRMWEIILTHQKEF